MKRYKVILLFAATFSFISCSYEYDESESFVVISGKITDPLGSRLLVYPNNVRPFYQVGSRTDSLCQEILIDSNGYFSDTIYNTSPQKYFVFHNPYQVVNSSARKEVLEKNQFFRLFLENKSSTYIELDSELDSIMNIDGPTAYINKYLFELESKCWEPLLNSLKTSKEDCLTALVKKHEALPEYFKQQELREIIYGKRLSALKDSNSINFDNIQFADSSFFNNEQDYFGTRNHSQLLRKLIDINSLNRISKSSIDSRIAKLLAIESTITNTRIRNDLIFRELYSQRYFAEDLDFENYETAYELFMSMSSNELHKNIVKKFFEKRKRISKGFPSPEFVGYLSHSGEKYSLKDFRGQYLYIDIWATWCAPCIREIPYLKSVQKMYKDSSKITFLNISIDNPKEDFEKWKRMVRKKELGGVSLIADNMKKSDFIADYVVTGLPRFILIDPQGYIVSPNAPRPSDPDLIELFIQEGI